MQINKIIPMNINIEVPQHKQIDTRWIEFKLLNTVTSRSNHAYTVQASNLYIHGGFNREVKILDDLQWLRIQDTPSQWVQLQQKGNKPGPLRNHTLSAFMSYIILCGGQKTMTQNNSQIYIYDLRSGSWTIATLISIHNSKQQFPPLDSHSCVLQGSKLYLFGGYNSKKISYTNDIIELDLKDIQAGKLTFEKISLNQGPKARGSTAMIIFKSEIYLFGGACDEGNLCDTWIYNTDSRNWKQVDQVSGKYWPQKRKGHSLVLHETSGNIFMFGGIKEVTKQLNDVNIYLRQRKKWVQIHSNTNELFDPSPTIKKQFEDSPNILFKRKRKSTQPFRLSLKTTTCFGGMRQQTTLKSLNKAYTQKADILGLNTLKRGSVVKQKKYKQFLLRKTKLLSQISKDSISIQTHFRSHSPTSEALIHSIQSIGDQVNNAQRERDKYEVPKVIFDESKGHVIGKKPCARDGHSGICVGEDMIIFGGDRHMVSFNDCYIFKMNKAMQSLGNYL